MQRRNRASAFATAVAGATFALFVSTTGVLAQSIKVVVNGEAVTSHEIDTRARFLRMVDRSTTGASVQRAAMEELVEEKLKLQEAKRVGITVPDSQVDSAFGSIAARLKVSPAQLAQGLSAQGISPETLKSRIRTQMVWQQLVMGRFSRQLKISDSQIVDALAKKDGGKGAQQAQGGGSTSEYSIQQVVLIVRGQGGDAAGRTREAEALRGRVSGCAGLVDSVKPIKEAMVKSLGKRTADELPENYREELGKLEVGKLSKPTRGPIGIEMLMICEKRDVAGDFSIRSKVEQELRNQEGEVYSRRYMNDLRRIAVIEYKK